MATRARNSGAKRAKSHPAVIAQPESNQTRGKTAPALKLTKLKLPPCRTLLGRTYFTTSISNHLRRQGKILPLTGSPKTTNLQLTPRESEVLQLIAEGNANKQTAAILSISIKTVEKHRHQVMSKLDLPNTASLTRYAIAHGIIESSVQMTIL